MACVSETACILKSLVHSDVENGKKEQGRQGLRLGEASNIGPNENVW